RHVRGRLGGYAGFFVGRLRGPRGGAPATVKIRNPMREISAGDRLTPAPPPAIPQCVPHAPASKVDGRIIALYDALATSSGGRDSIISITPGRRHGLGPRSVPAIYRNVRGYAQRASLSS